MPILGLPRSPEANCPMNVITLASRKGGVGKSTLTAHLAAFAHLMGHRCMVVDADPQGSLTLWHSMRADGGLVQQTAARGAVLLERPNARPIELQRDSSAEASGLKTIVEPSGTRIQTDGTQILAHAS
jgi:cellulose biosynthesis protein BcsQ